MSSIVTPATTRSAAGVPLSLRAAAARAGRDLLYLTIGLATSVVAFVVWVAGLTTTLMLLPFLIGLPVAVGFAAVMRWAVSLDRRNAVVLDGRALRGFYRPVEGLDFVARMRTRLGDPQTWRDLAWLILHSVVGFAFGVVALSLVTEAIGLALLPLWYWAIPGGAQFGLWTADSLPMATATALLAVPLAALTFALLRWMAGGHRALAGALLDRR